MNTEALKYIEKADKFFDGLSDPRSIKNKHSFTPPADNTDKLQSLYNNILPSIFADTEQTEKYTQALKNMGEKRSKQLLANTLHDLFQHQKNDKNGMIEQTRKFYIKLKIEIDSSNDEPELFKPFCIRSVDKIINKLSAIETAAIALLEMLQPGIDNPTTITQDQITKKLQDAVTKIQEESPQRDYKVTCELLRQDGLNFIAAKEWYLYDASPEQKRKTKETQRASSEEAKKPLAGLETLLKYFNNLRTLQEALFLLFNKLDVSYIQDKERKPEGKDLNDLLSSICIITDAQVLILQTALNNQQGLLGKEEEQKKNEKPLSYAELSNLVILWARMYRVYGYVEEKCIFLQHGKKIFASEFRYSYDLAKQFLMSFTTCAESVIDNCQEVLNLRSNEEQSDEYIQLEREIKNITEILKRIHNITESGWSGFSMAYVDLNIDKLLWKDLQEGIDLNLKILAAKETSRIERICIVEQIICTLYVIKSLVDPKKVDTIELAKAIENFRNTLNMIIHCRVRQLGSIYGAFLLAFRSIFECREHAIDIEENIQKLQPEEEESQSEQEYESQSEESTELEESAKAQSNPNLNAETAKTMNQALQQDSPITVSASATENSSQGPGSTSSTQDGSSDSPNKDINKIIMVVIAVLAVFIAVLVAFYYFFMKKA